ncbi:MAG: amidase [Rhodospirillales bacterium]|nr:amidase [Rhodospirillales bacterium]
MDLADLSAGDLARRIRDGEVTSLQVVNACIARIDSLEKEVGAWTHFDPEFARKQAEHCDLVRASGAAIGPLHGVPVGIKDIFDTEDFPTENGTVLDAGRRPMKDCTAVSRLKAAGCVIMGKTVTTELAVYSPGKTTNPHDPARTPGGSSSGSAAAVACGMVPLAIGSQTNGSVIRPASFCGVVGFKPSHGRISRAGVLSLSRQLDHVGVFARTVEDAALIADCLMGYDPRDPDTRPAAAAQLPVTALQVPPVEPHFAFIKTAVWDKADPATRDAFEELVGFLGGSCVEITPPEAFDHAVDHLKTVMHADLARSLIPYMNRGKAQISDILTGMIEDGEQTRAVDYNASLALRTELNGWIAEICTEFDALITPAAIGEAPLGLTATGDPVFCSSWTYLGVPAITLPLMQGENGLPLGVQLVSAPGDDARLLRNARWLSTAVADASDD